MHCLRCTSTCNEFHSPISRLGVGPLTFTYTISFQLYVRTHTYFQQLEQWNIATIVMVTSKLASLTPALYMQVRKSKPTTCLMQTVHH